VAHPIKVVTRTCEQCLSMFGIKSRKLFSKYIVITVTVQC